MVITITPLRVSFLGGGSDLPEFCNVYPSHVVSAAINKYITIAVKESFNGKNRISYSQTENTDTVEEIKHDIVRACMEHFGVKGLEIVMLADVPGNGTGLGSSSALCVGLVHALMTMLYRSEFNPTVYAQLAYEIERKAGHSVGMQDHFACACGGLKEYEFYNGDYKEINTYIPRVNLDEFENHIVLLHTGLGRNGNELLEGQAIKVKDNKFLLKDLCHYAECGISLIKAMQWEAFGNVITKSWNIKSSLADGISNDQIDDWIFKGLKAGAWGAKLCGAGAGGFLLFIAPHSKRDDIIQAVGLPEMKMKISQEGTKTIYADRNY